jgi:Zn finger protein HypA/HybF involved in hydrogenase expression
LFAQTASAIVTEGRARPSSLIPEVPLMTLATAPIPQTVGPVSPFYALVQTAHSGLLSSGVKCLFVEVLAGSVGRGDAVEVVRRDGSTLTLAAHELRHGLDSQLVLDLEKPHPSKADVEGAEIVRTPGAIAPDLPVDGGPGVERLVEAVRAARAQGFPIDWAKPVRPQAVATKPEELCGQLRRLPDEAIVLLVQKRIRDATAEHANPFGIMGDVERAAMLLDAIGLSEDGDRLLLSASAAVQGHKASAALRASATAAAIGVLSSEQISRAALGIGQKAGWAIGIEMGDAFARAFASNVAVGGEVVETALLEANRATGVAWCKRCHDIVQLRFTKSGLTGSTQLRCPGCDHKIDDPFLVVPADAAELQQTLRSQLA